MIMKSSESGVRRSERVGTASNLGFPATRRQSPTPNPQSFRPPLPCPAPADEDIENGPHAGWAGRTGGSRSCGSRASPTRRPRPGASLRRRAGRGRSARRNGARNVPDRPVVDQVAVALSPHVADRMEPLGRLGHFEHGHVLGQVGVEGPAKHLGRQRRAGGQADDLTQRVNARVGPPAGQHANRLAGDLFERLFERILHGRPIDLELPPGIGGAVVGNGEFQGAHLEAAAIGNCGPLRPHATSSPHGLRSGRSLR